MDFKTRLKIIFFGFSAVLLLILVLLWSNKSSIEKKLPTRGTQLPVSQTAAQTQETEEKIAGHKALDGFAGADPALQVGEELQKFLSEPEFFDRELSSYEKRMEEEKKNKIYPVVTSVEKDLRVQLQNKSGNLITGVPFCVNISDAGTYEDADKDGVIYIGDLKSGEHFLSVEEVEGYTVPEPMYVSVKNKIEYTEIPDISLLIKSEAEIVAAQEDTEVKQAAADADDTEVTDIREVDGEGQIGIDVSKYNGVIDWNLAKASGVKFAIIRLGYRGSTTGSLVMDPYYEQNIRGATMAGVKVGLYFFTQAISEAEAVEEASMVLALSKDYAVTYPIFIDTEGAGGNGRADRLDAETRTAVCKAFCETIRSAEMTAGVYAGRNWFNNNLLTDQLDEYVIWLAEYTDKPKYEGYYQMWQYTSRGSVEGIKGRVDLNVSYLTY